MSLILNIDTAIETASICLSEDEKVLKLAINEHQKDHAAWIAVAIQKMMNETGVQLKQLNAIAVTIGPGSYTGLRVGLSSAKGLCYTLNIPLITVGTLEMMAVAAKDQASTLLCPMIDARRMEVFTAVYDKKLKEIMPPQAMIINENSFTELLQSNTIVFYGNGSKKLQQVLVHSNASFDRINCNASHLPYIAFQHLEAMRFADLAYVEPAYLKEFFTPARKSKG